MKKPIAYIFIGPPGSGKGTIKDMIKDILSGLKKKFFESDTGQLFRDAIQCKEGAPILNDFQRKRMKKIQNSGRLQPPACAILMWMTHFKRNYKGQPYILIDGSPRRKEELDVLLSYLEETYQATIYFIEVSVSTSTAIQRMRARHKTHPRTDTSTVKKILKRLDEFDTLNIPVIEAIIALADNNYLKLDNEGSRESVKSQLLTLPLLA